jgi:hypothetical protein
LPRLLYILAMRPVERAGQRPEEFGLRAGKRAEQAVVEVTRELVRAH